MTVIALDNDLSEPAPLVIRPIREFMGKSAAAFEKRP